MSELLDSLKTYADSDCLPMHMPGHKRRMGEMGNPFFIDITEIDGFDDLHNAKGILKEAQQRAANVYHSEETHYLINGSTAGVLSAVSALVSFGGKILLARNSHKSAYHAALLRGLKIHYLYPQSIEKWGINGEILPSDVDNILQKEPDIEAVMLTSPTYDGVVSEVREIAKIAHHYGVPLIVDAAHGAHFPFSSYFPEDAVSAGADVVIHSLHKTLPSLTQTAILHLNGNRIDKEKIRNYLSIYQTSSPSYVLMASIDTCIKWAAEHRDAFESFCKRLDGLLDSLRKMHNLTLIEVPRMDATKVLISVQGLSINGLELAKILRTTYHIEVEMACSSYLCAITTVADREEDLHRLQTALLSIDKSLSKTKTKAKKPVLKTESVLPAKSVCTLLEANEAEKELCPLSDAKGRISGDFLTLYPPGIPLLAPGEMISKEMILRIFSYQQDGFTLYGIHADSLKVLKREREWERYFA